MHGRTAKLRACIRFVPAAHRVHAGDDLRSPQRGRSRMAKSKGRGVPLPGISIVLLFEVCGAIQVATASLCFKRSSVTLGDTFAMISRRSPFTRFASAMQRATSRRFNCPSANLSHFRRSFKQRRASSPNEYVPSSPIPPSCHKVRTNNKSLQKHSQQ